MRFLFKHECPAGIEMEWNLPAQVSDPVLECLVCEERVVACGVGPEEQVKPRRRLNNVAFKRLLNYWSSFDAGRWL